VRDSIRCITESRSSVRQLRHLLSVLAVGVDRGHPVSSELFAWEGSSFNRFSMLVSLVRSVIVVPDADRIHTTVEDMRNVNVESYASKKDNEQAGVPD